MKRLAVAALVTLVLVAALAALLDLSAEAAAEGTVEAARRLSFGGVGLAALLYALSYVGRGARLSALLPGRTPLLPLVSISARHNLFNLILPLRSGEASLPLMLRAELERPLAEGAAALVVARVLDLLSVAAWLLTGLALTGGEAHASEAHTLLGDRAAWLLAALGAVALALRPAARFAAERLAHQTSKLGSFAARSARHLADQPAARLAAAGLASLVTWGLTYGACFALLADMAGPGHAVTEALGSIDFATSLVGSTVLHLAGILPINTVAGIGPWEAGWTAGYVLVGLDRSAALASAVVSHVAILAFVSLLGGLGWLVRGRPAPASEAALDAAPHAAPEATHARDHGTTGASPPMESRTPPA